MRIFPNMLMKKETNESISEIPTQESKATVAGWSFLDNYIIMGHENGMVSQWNWKVHTFRSIEYNPLYIQKEQGISQWWGRRVCKCSSF